MVANHKQLPQGRQGSCEGMQFVCSAPGRIQQGQSKEHWEKCLQTIQKSYFLLSFREELFSLFLCSPEMITLFERANPTLTVLFVLLFYYNFCSHWSFCWIWLDHVPLSSFPFFLILLHYLTQMVSSIDLPERNQVEDDYKNQRWWNNFYNEKERKKTNQTKPTHI